MPNAIEPQPYRHTRRVLRGDLVGERDFVVLWAGGSNTWTDVDTLFVGLSAAMRREPRRKFVSLGGAMPGRDETTFYRFRRLIEESDLADRFVFTGWVANEDVPNYYFESDVGINIDRFSYEMLIGCRYRILDMLRAGLPVITTLGTEISHIVEQERLGATFAPGDAAGLTQGLLELARDEPRRRRSAARARDYVVKNRLVESVMQPLLRWAADPQPSSDRLSLAAAGPGVSGPSEPAAAPQSFTGRLGRAIETRGFRGGLSVVGATAVAALTDFLSRSFVRRKGVGPWGLDPREPPLATLVIRATSLGLAARSIAHIHDHYPSAEVSVLAPEALAEETRFETGADIIAAPRVEACGYHLSWTLVRQLRERRFDTVIVAGEGNRRAEFLALLTGADRRVEIRDDGAAHTFGLAAYKPFALLLQGLTGSLERLTLTGLVALAWTAITFEGLLWTITSRRAPRAESADEA